MYRKIPSWMKSGDVHRQYECRSIRKVTYLENRGQAP